MEKYKRAQRDKTYYLFFYLNIVTLCISFWYWRISPCWNDQCHFISINYRFNNWSNKSTGYDKYFVDHTLGIYPQGASNVPFTAAYFQSKGDPITDLTEDMAAEQKARTTYDNILALVDDEEIKKPIRFLREREIIHYQRFAEALEIVKGHLNSDNYYAYNPAFRNGKCNKK